MNRPGTKAESEDLWSRYDLEYRAYEDDAWYDIYVVLDATVEKLMVKYWSSSEEYEIVFTVAEFATEAQVDDLARRFRPVSVKLENNEGGMLSIGTAVCAAHAIGDDLYRFYDAVIEVVKISGDGRCNVTNGHCSDNVETWLSFTVWTYLFADCGCRSWENRGKWKCSDIAVDAFLECISSETLQYPLVKMY
ncbi:hypothetical protein ACS0TY_019245 [Phlomoides rotata]